MGAANSIRAIRSKHSLTVELRENLASRIGLTLRIENQETRRVQKSMGNKVFMEDRDADLSPCNFATTHASAERRSFISL